MTEPQPTCEDTQAVILEVTQLIKDLDDTPLDQMTPLFYQHGFEELSLAVRDLLRILGANQVARHEVDSGPDNEHR